MVEIEDLLKEDFDKVHDDGPSLSFESNKSTKRSKSKGRGNMQNDLMWITNAVWSMQKILYQWKNRLMN